MIDEVTEYCKARNIQFSNIVTRHDNCRVYPMMGYVRKNISTSVDDFVAGATDHALYGAFKNEIVVVGDDDVKKYEDEIYVYPQFFVGSNSVSFLNNESNGAAVLVEFKYEPNENFIALITDWYSNIMKEAKELDDLNTGADHQDAYLLAYADTWMIIYETKNKLFRISTVDQSNYDWSIWFNPDEFKVLGKCLEAATKYDMEMSKPYVLKL